MSPELAASILIGVIFYEELYGIGETIGRKIGEFLVNLIINHGDYQ